ncbi:MAG: hypothetical protein IPK60_19300 [Sandaracinaceae bacterium]|nr:hypothetical protein [Sandaracinaceae bacterium]
MTVFCPNCGKPNTDEAAQCVSCSTALTPKVGGASGSKFKGTMMMTGVTPPRPPGPASGAPPAPVTPGGGPAMQPVPTEQKQNMGFQQTMLGGPMAPPSTATPAAGGFSPPAQGGFGASPASPATPVSAGFAAPAAPVSGGFGAPPAAQAAAGGFSAPSAPTAPAAQAGGFGSPPGGGAPPPGGGGFGSPPGGGFGGPPGGPPPGGGGFGAPPGGGGFGGPPGGPPPGGGGFGAPPGGGGFGGPPGGQPPGGFGQPPGGQPPGGFGPPMQPQGGNNGWVKWVAIGCGVLLLLGLCVVGSCYFIGKKAQSAVQEASQGGGAAAQDPNCVKAKACCIAVLSQDPNQAGTAQSTCETTIGLGTTFGAAACPGLLQGFQNQANASGKGMPAECQ